MANSKWELYKSMVSAQTSRLPDTKSSGWLETLSEWVQLIVLVAICVKLGMFKTAWLLIAIVVGMVIIASFDSENWKK
jgi:xanthine/uracil permease